MGNLYIGLLHYPMRNRRGDVVTTSMTSMDVHDIARTAKTFGAARYYVITPLKTQREIARRLRGYWTEQERTRENTNRGEALELVSVLDKLEEGILDISDREEKEPLLVGTSARHLDERRMEYEEATDQLREETKPMFLLFGTGWGMADELTSQLDYLLPPIEGIDEFNHLSVRAAVAVTLDRVRGSGRIN
ncbi:MAG: RNA methyltransferase [Candidatus Bipolaricaulota bacterium]|nr:RNA methyltransferase [Candidatus Bipolaricaulota bacterium]MBS3791486.1 RNA methyltransferase [Candidatus Bipolaricaulota bacterium]